MKQIILPAAFFLCLCSVLVFQPGCGTTPVQTTIKAEGVLITSVDTGMNLWHDYVVAHLTDGKVTQKQIDTVKNGYNAYVTAQSVAKAAIEKLLAGTGATQADVDTANAAVKTAEQSLISTLNTYIK